MCNLRWKGCASRVRGTMKAVPARLRGVEPVAFLLSGQTYERFLIRLQCSSHRVLLH